MLGIAKLVSAGIAIVLAAVIAATGAFARPAAPTHLAIQHVQHVWSQEGRVSTSLRLKLSPGARLHVVNRDSVPQQLVQLNGPSLRLRGHMMPGMSQLIRFSKPGVYRFKSKVITMDSPTEITTVTPGNVLRLTVSVG